MSDISDWKQRALYNLMSDISEDCWCAGWMHGNEYALWTLVTDPKSKGGEYGGVKVDQRHIDDLRAISNEIGGWIRWRDDEEDPSLPCEEWGPVFTPMAEWLAMYERKMKP